MVALVVRAISKRPCFAITWYIVDVFSFARARRIKVPAATDLRYKPRLSNSSTEQIRIRLEAQERA